MQPGSIGSGQRGQMCFLMFECKDSDNIYLTIYAKSFKVNFEIENRTTRCDLSHGCCFPHFGAALLPLLAFYWGVCIAFALRFTQPFAAFNGRSCESVIF